jgi:hypothetical protein
MPHLLTRSFGLGTLITLALCLAQASDAQQAGTGRLEGTVRDSVHARPLAGAKVLVLEEAHAEAPRETTSDSPGQFHFDSLPPGGYMVARVTYRVTITMLPVLFCV